MICARHRYGLADHATTATQQLNGDGGAHSRHRRAVAEVAQFAGARLDHQHISHAHGEIPGRVDAQILLFVAGANNLDHGLGHLLPGLIDVGRLGAEDCDVGPLERAVGEEQAWVSEMIAAAALATLRERFDTRANAVDQLLVAQAGQEPPGVHAAGDFELDLAGGLAGEAIELGGNICSSASHSVFLDRLAVQWENKHTRPQRTESITEARPSAAQARAGFSLG